MNDPAVRVVLVPGTGFEACAGLADRLAGRGVEARIVPAGAGVGTSRWLGRTRWGRCLAGRRLAQRLREPVSALIHAVGLDAADLAVEFADRWKVPYLLTIDEFLRPSDSLRLARRWCRGIVATSDDLGEDLTRGLGLPSRFVTVVPAGIAPAPGRRAARDQAWVPVVGTAAGDGPGSGLPTFLAAARRVLDSGVNAEFVLAGLGDRSAPARRMAEGLGLVERVTIAEGSELARSFWPVLDAYVDPSLRPCSGRELLTAMSHGVPAIVSAVAGLRGVVDGGRAGRIVPPGDSEALAAALLGLLADRDGADRLGRAGRMRIVEGQDPEREADALAARYRAAIASGEVVGARVRADAAASAVASRRS